MSDLKLLDGVKVVDMSAFVAAPMAAEILAEYGADVVRIEPLTGDELQAVAHEPHAEEKKRHAAEQRYNVGNTHSHRFLCKL